jgi:hypothetical protein
VYIAAYTELSRVLLTKFPALGYIFQLPEAHQQVQPGALRAYEATGIDQPRHGTQRV